jgi:histidinol-phosphate phosphatase family protein
METELGRAGAFVDAIYYCPHHPDKGFPGERPELKINCSCRKPAPGLIADACRDMNLDLARSWMIGDSLTDVQTAANAGIRSILVETGVAGGGDVGELRPHYRFPTLADAADFLAAGEPAR